MHYFVPMNQVAAVATGRPGVRGGRLRRQLILVFHYAANPLADERSASIGAVNLTS
jgi:hypothetical protein